MNGDFTFDYYMILELLSSNTMCSHNNWGWRWRLQLTWFQQWDICPSLIQGKPSRFTIRSSIYSFLYSYPVSIRDCLQGHVCSRKGVFSWKTPNHSLGPQISVYLQNPGTILIIGIIFQYPVIIRFGLAHPEQLSAISGSGGREQLNLQINSLACLETSELPHVSSILFGTKRLPLLQILSFNGYLLHWKHHP